MLDRLKQGGLPWLWLSLLLLVADRLSKVYFEGLFDYQLYRQIVVIPDYFSWTLAYNKGAAFSFLAGHSGWQRWFFAAIAVGVSVALVIWLRRLPKNDRWTAFALAMVLGGALGNLYDRVVLGQVVDFILVHWRNEHYFPAFNLADCGITVGAVMLFKDVFKKDEAPSGEKHV